MALLSRTAALSLWVHLLLVVEKLGVVVNGQTAPVTATINISYDPTSQLITFDQSGSVPVKDEPDRQGIAPLGVRFIRFDRDASISFGIENAASSEVSYVFPNFNADFRCSTRATVIGTTTPGIPGLNIFADSTGDPTSFIYVNQGYISGSSLAGTANSNQAFESLAQAGFVEGTTCFFEYDVDSDTTTGTPINGYDAAIQWNIIPQESSMPSFMPSTSQEPSSMPIGMPSSMPTSQGCETTTGKTTKTPTSRSSKGKMTKAHMSMMMMTKASKTAAPTLCPETKAPKSSS